MCGCKNTTQNNHPHSKVSAVQDGDKITFYGVDSETEIGVYVDNVSSNLIKLAPNSTISITNALRCLNKANEIALLSAKTNGEINVRFKIENKFDSTFVYRLPTGYVENYPSNIIGHCAPLKLINSGNEFKGNQKRWLYKNGANLQDSILNKFLGISQYLLKTNSTEFEVHDDIPIFPSFSGKQFTISSELPADYYVLFAASNQKEIDDFVEEIIANDFELTSKKVGKMSCYRNLESGGYKCIFLIGINTDWSYSQLPLGVIGIDNLKPIKSNGGLLGVKSQSTELNFKNNVRINLPSNIESLNGYFSIDTGDFRGDDAQFTIIWSGDIESISIKREIHRDYQRYFMRPEVKTIKLSDKSSPYNFVYKLDLAIGDNFIPITVTDKRGNSFCFDLNIPMVRVKDEPGINIDNNVNVYN